MNTSPAGVPLSTDLDDPEAVPYFCWDEPMTVRELRDQIRQDIRKGISGSERRRTLSEAIEPQR